jgi:hypothetical protein
MSCGDKAAEFAMAFGAAIPVLLELASEVATKKVKAKTIAKALVVLPAVLQTGYALIECLAGSGKTAEADAVRQKVDSLQQEYDLLSQYAAA